MFVLEAYDLYRFYHTGDDETRALRGVTLLAGEGEIVAVMGPSGSGKSTLLHCLSGIDEPDGGYVVVAGKRITRRPEALRAAIRCSETGIMMQNHSLLEHLTIEENIALRQKLVHKSDSKKLRELIEHVGLSQRAKAYPSQISGGEAARAALAVALSTGPKLLLADEPTGEVDAETEERLVELFKQYKEQSGTAILATHSQNLSQQADRIIHLYDGRFVDE